MNEPATGLAEHLQTQYELLGDFIALLEREQAALSESPVPIDTLSAITEAKRSLAGQLESLETARQAICEYQGYGHDLAEAEAIATEHGCGELWYAVVEHANEARMRNQTNGLAVQNRLDMTRQTLDFLRSHNTRTLYTADGQHHPVTGRYVRGGA